MLSGTYLHSALPKGNQTLEQIEWLASHGSLIRLDAISLGLAPEQTEQAVITPSQKRVHKVKKYASRRCASVKPSL